MSDALAGLLCGTALGVLVGLLLSSVTNVQPDEWATKHCQHISDRHEFEKCKHDFLGDK